MSRGRNYGVGVVVERAGPPAWLTSGRPVTLAVISHHSENRIPDQVPEIKAPLEAENWTAEALVWLVLVLHMPYHYSQQDTNALVSKVPPICNPY